MKNMLLIMNPNSGQRKANRFLPDIIAAFNRADYRVWVHMTACRGDATQAAKKWAGEVELVVCCGGDGTLNETLNGIMATQYRPRVGYIPSGTTNDFAASLKLSGKPLQAARDIVEGAPMVYDVCRFGDRYFSYVASFGAFTKSSYATSQTLKNALGHTAYLLSGVRELTQLHSSHVRFEFEDQVIEDDFVFGAICNSTSVGGILTLDPKQVDMADGLCEVLLIRMPKNLSELADILRAVRSQKYDSPQITFVSARKVTVIADPDMAWTLDGEREDGHDRVEVENIYHAISLVQRKETP
jgi:YegS/Rv2252/BmrU family lipid kinase